MIEKRSGYLGTGGDSHLVTAGTARTFATKKAARAEVDRLSATPQHFLTSSSYSASVVRVGAE